MNDIIKEILPILDIKTLMSFRQVCRQIDKLLDFNYWIEKFRRDEMLIFTTKLPASVAGWIHEYLIVKDVYMEAKLLWKNNYIRLTNDNTRLFDSHGYPLGYPNQYMLTRLLPNNYTPSGFFYSIVLCDKIYDLDGWIKDYSDDYVFDPKLFLLRLLYYFPNVCLTGKNNECLRFGVDYKRRLVRK